MPDNATGGGNAQPRNPSTGQFTSIFEAASALDSLLTPKGPQGEGEALEGEEPAGEELAGAEEPGEEGAETEGAEVEETEELEEEEPGSEEDEDQDQNARGRQFTVRVDGKDERVTESELIAGYSRQSDYTRKTQALANERKAFEQEHAGVRQERAEYAQLLPQLRKSLEQGMGAEPNWAKLQEDDQKNGTTTYANAWARWQHGQQRIMMVRAEEQRVAQQQQRAMAAQQEQYLKQERSALLTALPAWKDPKVAKASSQAIANMMQSLGYADNDIAIHDHRALIIADKAAKYDALMAQRPQLRQKMRNAPVVRPGGGAQAPRTGARQAAQRLSQSGTVKDAASLLEHLI